MAGDAVVADGSTAARGGAGRLDRAPLLEILKRSTTWLEGRGLPRPRLDVELLMAHALGIERMQLYLQFDRPLAGEELDAIRDLVRRRGLGEPVAYLTGRWGFHALDLAVDARVLVPRPETETLVDAALERLAGVANAVVADVGTGSGCIALALAHARDDLTALGSDLSEAALHVARDNAARLGLDARVRFAHGDLLAPWRDEPAFGHLAAVVSNPPYVVRGDPALEAAVARFEPELALYVDGTDPFAIGARIADQARSALVPGGWLLVELGAGSDTRAREALTALDYTDIDVLPDLAGIGRVVVGRTRGA
ncbi:MAG: peptide chain release factor N(5)-glutamine methyltransferase [Planctomycetota bacterium]